MTLPAELHTARLHLRPPRVADSGWIFSDYACDPEVTRYLTWSPHRHEASVRTFLEDLLARDGPDRAWVLARRADGRGLGMLDARFVTGWHVEVGYTLARAWWGEGLTTEALVAVRDAVMALPQVFRLSAVTDVDNTASARVLCKAGLQREGVLRRLVLHPNASSEPRDAVCHALVRGPGTLGP